MANFGNGRQFLTRGPKIAQMNTFVAGTKAMRVRSAILINRRWYRYSLAACLAIAAVAGTRLLMSLKLEIPFVLLVTAIVLSSWVWGIGPGMFAALVGEVAVEAGLRGQYSSAATSNSGLFRLVLLIGVAALVSYARPASRRQLRSGAASLAGSSPGDMSERVSQLRTAATMESVRDGAAIIVDRNWRLIFVNEAAARLLGRNREELQALTFPAAIEDAKNSEWFPKLPRAMQRSERIKIEALLLTIQRWFEFDVYPCPEGLCLLISDITGRKRAEALRPLPLWEDDREFTNILKKVEYSLVDRGRCYMLYQFAKQTRELPGDVAEVGVYKGGTAKLLAEVFACKTDKLVHLFDTFEGMPATDPEVDHHRAGDLSDTSLEAVQRQLRDNLNARFYKGFFPATAGPIEGRRFCLAHVDADIYQSVKDSCAFFYPRMENAGVMVFDDYGFSSCPGARKAVNEFFAEKPESPFYLPSGQCVVVRK